MHSEQNKHTVLHMRPAITVWNEIIYAMYYITFHRYENKG